MTNLTIVILAAGEGKRMNSDLPKVLHLFDGLPMLVRIIQTITQLRIENAQCNVSFSHKSADEMGRLNEKSCKTVGFTKNIIIVTGKHDEQIKKTVSKYMPLTDLVFVKQPVPKGTGDAIKSCLSHLNPEDDVLILNGDTPLITRDILTKFINNSLSANIIIAKVSNPYGYGRIVYDEANYLKEIIEEKDCDEKQKQIKVINSGIYLVKGWLLAEYIPKIDNDNAQKEYYLTDLFKLIKRFSCNGIRTYLLDENETKYISGVNTQEELTNLYSYV